MADKQQASRHHFNFRLYNGVLHSQVMPKEPSPDPSIKRLAVVVEDDPLECVVFAGAIPPPCSHRSSVQWWRDDGGREQYILNTS